VNVIRLPFAVRRNASANGRTVNGERTDIIERLGEKRMSKALKAFVCSLLLIAVVLAPACRSKKKPVVTPTNTATTDTSTIPTMTTTQAPTTTIATNTDFVQTDTQPPVESTQLPTDIEELNRVALSRGYIQDAFFGFDESTLSGDAQTALTSSAEWLKSHTQYNLLIEGHCDERGTEQYNLALGDRRANIAKEYLMTLGVDGSRIRTVSYGEERPFDSGHDDSAWAKNRRAHLVLVGR
jgi:peptidoglycan-associated lipoprotein